MSAKRTVRTITLIVETTALSDSEHDKRVYWAEQNIIQSNSRMDGAFVAVLISDEDGKTIRFGGSGDPTDETRELIEELKKP